MQAGLEPVGGALTQSGASSTLSGASFSRGQSVYVTVVAALSANRIGAPPSARPTIVYTGSLIDPSACCSSIASCPSGLCCADRRTE